MLALVSPAPPPHLSSNIRHPTIEVYSGLSLQATSDPHGDTRPQESSAPPRQHPDYITSCFWICYPLYLVMCEAHNYKDYKESPPAVFNNDQLVFICETFPTCRVPVYMEGGGGAGDSQKFFTQLFGGPRKVRIMRRTSCILPSIDPFLYSSIHLWGEVFGIEMFHSILSVRLRWALFSEAC